MEIQLKLYGSSKILSDKETLSIQLPNDSNIEKVRDILSKIISEKHPKSNLENTYINVFVYKSKVVGIRVETMDVGVKENEIYEFANNTYGNLSQEMKK